MISLYTTPRSFSKNETDTLAAVIAAEAEVVVQDQASANYPGDLPSRGAPPMGVTKAEWEKQWRSVYDSVARRHNNDRTMIKKAVLDGSVRKEAIEKVLKRNTQEINAYKAELKEWKPAGKGFKSKVMKAFERKFKRGGS